MRRAMKRDKVAYVLIGAVLLAVLLAYFGRPKPPLFDLVSPRQELPDIKEHLPDDTAIAERVSRSFGLAMVMVRSPYSASNAIALESLRTWAAERFQREPGFLHPVSLEIKPVPNETFIAAVFYNLGAYIYYGLEDLVGSGLKAQIARFHDSSEYLSFRTAYFDLFDADAESATLLARYQSERARLAVDVILWAVFSLVLLIYGAVSLAQAQPGSRFEKLQRLLAGGWLLLALSYMVMSFAENLVSMLVSSVVAALIGLYLWRPFSIARREQGGFAARPITLTSNWVALALWLSYSFLTIQILTWIRTGTLTDPDPITLLASSLSGNFLHDPAQAKRLVMRIVGVAWILLVLWTARQSTRDARAAREAEKGLASLKGPFSP